MGEYGMDVSGASGVGGSGPVRPVSSQPVQPTSASGVHGIELPKDEVSISSAARLLGELQNDPSVRAERLDEIRQAIADGVYETPAKLEAALLKLLDEIRRGAV
jgi:negative regulator of flagellin synthesis FlgM